MYLKNRLDKFVSGFKPFLYYRFPFDLVSKFNVGHKSLLQQGLLEPEFYGDLVYKFRKIYACNDFTLNFVTNHSSIYKDWVQHKCNTTECMHGS